MRRATPTNPDQGALFALAPTVEQSSHAGDPHVYLPVAPRATQTAAAIAVWPRSGTQRARVLAAISKAEADGLTDEEIGARLGLSLNSVRPRRLELVQAGLVIDSGRTRPTRGGKAAIAWATQDHGGGLVE